MEQRVSKLKSQMHGDLRKKMKTQRAGREAKLNKMMEPAAVEGGGREGAAITNGLHRGRDGAVDRTVQ